MVRDDPLREDIEEAVAAFDAGNHAWGRFFVYVLRPYRGPLPAPDAAPVRAALQEAALAVPQATDLDEVRAFHAALLAIRRELTVFLALLPDPLRASDLLTAPDAFAEAIDLLDPWVNGP